MLNWNDVTCFTCDRLSVGHSAVIPTPPGYVSPSLLSPPPPPPSCRRRVSPSYNSVPIKGQARVRELQCGEGPVLLLQQEVLGHGTVRQQDDQVWPEVTLLHGEHYHGVPWVQEGWGRRRLHALSDLAEEYLVHLWVWLWWSGEGHYLWLLVWSTFLHCHCSRCGQSCGWCSVENPEVHKAEGRGTTCVDTI